MFHDINSQSRGPSRTSPFIPRLNSQNTMSNHFFSSNKKSLEKPSSSNESGLTNDFRDDLDFDIPSVEDLQRGDLVSDVPHNYNIPSMNTLAQDAVVTGNINVDGELKIYGKVIGDITSSSNVIIGESGVVEGNVKATGMEVAGRFNGNAEISGEFLASSTGTIYGDLVLIIPI